MFWMEADSYGVRLGWLDALVRETRLAALEVGWLLNISVQFISNIFYSGMLLTTLLT